MKSLLEAHAQIVDTHEQLVRAVSAVRQLIESNGEVICRGDEGVAIMRDILYALRAGADVTSEYAELLLGMYDGWNYR